jgi:hypothetical protein
MTLILGGAIWSAKLPVQGFWTLSLLRSECDRLALLLKEELVLEQALVTEWQTRNLKKGLRRECDFGRSFRNRALI